MSQIASDAKTAPTSVQELYGPVEAELAEVVRLIREELSSEHAYVEELVRYGCLLSGKRLRPALLLLCGRLFGKLTRQHRVLAAVMEMIHTASLLHDDVLDGAEMRRHLATVNSRWDNKTSVLLGDYLFTHAFSMASGLDSALVCRVIGRTTNVICEGELRQKGARGDFSLSEEEYLEIIAAKTAELYACSCYFGAHSAGASQEWSDRLTRYGRDVGTAFQIIDDVLDLQGDEMTMGKSLGTDLAQQKPTLPVIRVLQRADAAERRDVLSILNSDAEDRLDALAPFFQRHDAFEYSSEMARGFARRAGQHLADLKPSPSREALLRLTEFVVSRTL